MTTPEKPTVEHVRVDTLKVDPNVQRHLDPNWVQNLADNWDDDKLGVMEVSDRDGDYFVTDGQHRRAALIKRGRGAEIVPVLVMHHQDLEREARNFVARNNERRLPNPVDTYRVQLVAKDPVVLEIQEVIASHGLTVSLSQSANTVSAVAALRWVHATGGKELLDKVLTVTRDAWGADDYRNNQAILRALGTIIKRFGAQLNLAELARKVADDATPRRLMGKGKAIAGAWGKSVPLGVADAILESYNRGRRTRRVVM